MLIAKRKGQKELTMIISLIILLVLAVVIISLILTFLKPEAISGLGKEEIALEQAKLQCTDLCNGIRNALSEDLNSRIWEYCVKTFNLQKKEGFSDLIIVGEGEDSYCRDFAHCYNIQGGECQSRGVKIDAQVCRDAMCKVQISKGVSVDQAEDNIRQVMPPGSCQLRIGSEVAVPGQDPQQIFVETWWEKYFESPDCSNVQVGGSGGGIKAKLDQFCKSQTQDSAGNSKTYIESWPNVCVDNNLIGKSPPSGVQGRDWFDEVVVSGTDVCPGTDSSSGAALGIFCRS